MTVEPLRTVRDHLSEFVDRAEREHERVVVTRNGRPAAVLIGYDDLASLEETLDILSDPDALAEVRQAEAEVARGDAVRGVDAIKALRSPGVSEPYDIQLSASAARAVQDKLPEAVAAAVIEFVTGSLRANPRRVGKPLARELRGRYAARRGAFRVIYSIDDAEHLVTVLPIEHRADVYRPR